MSDAKRPFGTPAGLSIESDGDFFVLSIRVTKEELGDLLSAVLPMAALARHERRRQRNAVSERQKDIQARVNASVECGRRIIGLVEEHRAAGCSNAHAWALAARDAGLSVSMAHTYANVARPHVVAARNARVIALYRKGKSNDQIAAAVKLSAGTVARIIQKHRSAARAAAAAKGTNGGRNA